MQVDLPGHGKSAGPGEQSIPVYADHLEAWMQALGLSRAVLVGHSMGGAIAMQMALQAPEKVAGLGLIATGARLRVHPQILENSASQASFQVAADLILSKSFHPETKPQLVELAGKRLREVRPSVLHGDLVACEMFDLRAEIAAIACPTLVICGDQDEMTPLRFSQFLARSIPNARLVIIPAAGHMVALEQPKAIAVSLQSFLAGLGNREPAAS